MNLPELLEAAGGLLDAAHRVRLTLNEGASAAAGLTIEQALALARIERANEPLALSAIASQLSRSDNATFVLMRNLEARGFVTRHRDTDGDKRVVRRSLTPKGREALARFTTAAQEVFASLEPSDASGPLGQLASSLSVLAQAQARLKASAPPTGTSPTGPTTGIEANPGAAGMQGRAVS